MSGGVAKRVLNMVLRGVIQLVTDTGKFQVIRIQGLDTENRENVTRIGEYGLASNPPPGSEYVAVAVGGSRSHLLIIATESAQRRTGLLPGESALHNALTSEEVLLNAAGMVILGKDALDPVVRKSDLQAVVDKFNNHSHGGNGALPPTAPMQAVANGSSKVFAK